MECQQAQLTPQELVQRYKALADIDWGHPSSTPNPDFLRILRVGTL